MDDKLLDIGSLTSYNTHTSRGIRNIIEYERLIDDKGTGKYQAFITCREIYCKWSDTTSVDIYLKMPTIFCPICGSENLTAEWLEHNLNGHAQYCVPDRECCNNKPCGPGFPDIENNILYYYTYHRNYQVTL